MIKAEWTNADALDLQPTCNQLATDVISRQAAIDALDTGLWGVEWDKALATAMLKDLPSAQPERKKGKWINRSLNILYPEWERYTCSACGKHSYNYDFCPNCGSYNGGESDDKG